ncbi:MAG: hypothetical protein ACK4IB_07805 [Erythrobacter sp.]
MATRAPPAARHITRDPWPLMVWRLVAGFGGGYLATSGFVALTGSVLPLIGMARGEALSLALLLALPVYIPLCLLMFATRAPVRDGLAVVGGGGALMALAAAI